MKKYNVIYADPPWSYKSSTGRDFTKGSKQKYSVLSIEDISRMGIKEILQDEAVLFLWATVPLLPEAIGVLSSWGFKYKTALFWDKKSITTGFWFRNQVEVLLLGIRGGG